MPCRACFNCGRPGHMAKDCNVAPRMVNPVNARNSTVARGACFECGGTGHFKAACPRLNQAQRPGGGHPNQVEAIDGGQGRGNNGNQARGRAFMLGVEETRQDPNILMGTFTLNNHYAITLFDSSADYNFVSTTFIPLLGIELSDLGFSYEIEIASGQLVEIDKVIKGCKLEINGHVFDINFMPFGSGSFDVIIGMDWLSNHKAKIICHEKVVRIPLLDGKVLKVLGERPEEKERHLMSAKAKEQKQKEMVVVRDFPEVFLSIELSDLGFSYEIEIASGQLVEIDKVIKGCKLEINGHVFDINFMPFGSGSFDVIIGMDWLSNHKAKIICHEKVVRIPLLDGNVLKVLGERPEEKARHLMSAKAKEQKQKEMVVVRDFPEVFLSDLSGLPPIREIEFRIELVPRAIPVLKSPYQLAPSEMEELSGQLKELQDKGFIRPSLSPWGGTRILFMKKKGRIDFDMY
ncbi:putative reverse transcriptase domain-containing protein [Tanacetum coccineum]|uniref:Reverse transcriptase domain-containing protein n=1 Tax=Tanacetum coccineum TaxID=301880 RepID=A0ABQ5EF79_9ASTR